MRWCTTTTAKKQNATPVPALLPCIPALQVVSSTLAGAALGSLTGGGFADALGRRASFMLCALPMLVGPLLSATATSLNMMVAGRFLAGVAIGLSSALVPLYISEVRGGCCKHTGVVP